MNSEIHTGMTIRDLEAGVEKAAAKNLLQFPPDTAKAALMQQLNSAANRIMQLDCLRLEASFALIDIKTELDIAKMREDTFTIPRLERAMTHVKRLETYFEEQRKAVQF